MRRSLEPALGRGLLTAEGQHWRWQRRAASPLFRHEVILAFLPQMLAAAERRRDLWLAMRGCETDVMRDMMLTTFEIILETMLSGPTAIDGRRAERAISEYMAPLGWVIAQSLLRLPAWIPFPGRHRMTRARTFLRGEILRIVAQRRASDEARHDLIALLLAAHDPETGRSMSDQEIADNLLTFVTAGHETTALALTWTFYLLDRHPEAAKRIREEVRLVAGDGELRAGHIEALSFTRQVLQEAMRLYPPAAVITRASCRATRIGGEIVPPGTQVYVPTYAVHRHASLWHDPDRFIRSASGPRRSDSGIATPMFPSAPAHASASA